MHLFIRQKLKTSPSFLIRPFNFLAQKQLAMFSTGKYTPPSRTPLTPQTQELASKKA
jgi:hypothetical protein